MSDTTVEPTGRDSKEVKEELILNRNSAIVGGFLDFALFTADVEHLKYVIESGKDGIRHYDLLLWSLIASLALQVVTGVLLCFSGYYSSAAVKPWPAKNRSLLNNVTMALVVVISVLSVIITTFGTR